MTLRRHLPLLSFALVVAVIMALPGCGDDAVDTSTKPDVTVPDESATELEITDIVEGDGDEVEAGDTVTAHYVGVGQQSGEEFDTSWGGQPATFPLDGVIEGWSKGLVGMKVGGRRELVIPGDMAYGANPPSPDIQPDETLVFVVDLKDVQKG